MSVPAAQVMDKVKGWDLQSVIFLTEWLNYYPVIPLGVSGLINRVSSIVIRKCKLFVLCLESHYFFSHCSELHQELLNCYISAVKDLFWLCNICVSFFFSAEGLKLAPWMILHYPCFKIKLNEEANAEIIFQVLVQKMTKLWCNWVQFRLVEYCCCFN